MMETLAVHENVQQQHTKTLWQSVHRNSTVRSFLAGSFTGVCSTFMFQPFDLIKTRIQTRLISGANDPHLTHRMLPIIRTVLKEERLPGLWRGTVPSLLRTVPGVGIYFSSIHFMQQKAGPGCSSGCVAMIGIVGRLFASLSVLPFTVIKARYESGLFQYTSVFGALRTTASKEGIRSLYSGFVPTLLRDAPFSGIYLMFYQLIKNNLSSRYHGSTWTAFIHFSSGITAGIIASLVTHPFDVLKTHIQLMSNADQRRLVSSLRRIWRTNGMSGFFAGLVPRIARRTLMTATSWTLYEHVLRVILERVDNNPSG